GGRRKGTGSAGTGGGGRILICRPTTAGDETACAGKIVKRLGAQAFRRPLTDADFKGLMRFFEEGRTERNFESGVASAIEAMLASPQFVFRLEPAASHESTRTTAARTGAKTAAAKSTGVER